MRLLSRARRPAPGPGTPDAKELLRRSGLFDADWYLATYPEVAASGIDPITDYLTAGVAQGRDPNAVFSTSWYLATYADVRDSGMNPLLHYAESGADEGRSAGPKFDTAYYLAENPEIASSGLHPLLHYLRFGRHEGRNARPFDEAEAFEAGVRARQQALSGPAATLYQGARADHVHFPLQKAPPRRPGDPLPLPPLRLAQRIGSVTLEDFEASGKGIRDTIVRALPKDFDWTGARCLDFGSGVGRSLRHFGEEAEQAEIWGCDIDGSSIRWSVQNLSPPFRFFQIGEIPTLPFEDDSFDLVYAISVLSHIHSTWHQWLMEIRRVTKPGGVVFISFMGQPPMEEMLGEPYWTRGDDFGMYVKGPHNNWNDGGPMIFVSPGWLTTFWGSLFDIDYIAMDGLLDYQSFCLMRKPERGAPMRTEVPVIHTGTRQDFDPDAVGRIVPQVDLGLPIIESHGLDLKAGKEAEILGWITFRGDAPAEVDVLIDGRPVTARTEFDPGPPYRDWEDTVRHAWAAAIDLAGVAPGRHELEMRFRSLGGKSHALTIPLTLRAA